MYNLQLRPEPLELCHSARRYRSMVFFAAFGVLCLATILLARGSVVGRGSAVLQAVGGLVAGRRRKLETRLGGAVEPEAHRASWSNRDAQNGEDRLGPAERIRCLWVARECAAVGFEEWRMVSGE